MKGKHIVLGVTGGIAAYKSCYLVRELVKRGADVKVVMTEAATKFVTPLTFSALSGHDVACDLWEKNQSTSSDIGTRHIDLARWADLFVIAPASANTLAKLTFGLADNLLTVLVLACQVPVVLAPTMDADMFVNPQTQRNLSLLKERGFFVLPPDEGEHASGLHGPGRLPDIEPIVDFIGSVLEKTHQDLKSVRILVTAGPTHEAIDPVRFIGNRSSGRMGFALANAASLRGAKVTLISGPVSLETPRHVERINVESAREMHDEVIRHGKKADVIIMAAAVADFAPENAERQKIKKGSEERGMLLRLSPTRDILRTLGEKKNGKILIGFALETAEEMKNAKEKLKKKNLDLIVLNSLKDEGAGFGTDTNVVTLIDRSGSVKKFPKAFKFDVANNILDHVRTKLKK